VAYMFIILLGAIGMTYAAKDEDRIGDKPEAYQRAVAKADELKGQPEKSEEYQRAVKDAEDKLAKLEKAEEYLRSVEDAERKSGRIRELIRGPRGIGKQGAVELLRNDPKTRGPEVFARNCAACHRFDEHDGTGKKPTSLATASDLGQFGKRAWIRGFLENPGGPKYFGPTRKGLINGKPIGNRFTDEGQMAGWAKDNFPKMKKREVDGIVEFLIAQGQRTDIEPPDSKLVEVGKNFWENGSDDADACGTCHGMNSKRKDLREADGSGVPDLTGYASKEWLRSFLMNPGAGRHYGDNNAMPAFKDRMTEKDLDILVRWLRHRWYEPEK